MKRAALGKGIAALIPEGSQLRPAAAPMVAVAEVRPNPLQPRRHFDPRGLAELADSIRRHGVLQPVVVTRAPQGGYHLVAGERRWRAAKQAGLTHIPAVVRESGGDAESLTLALIENLQREDLTPIEEARAFSHLRSELGLSQEEIAARVGRDRSTVANSLRLLRLAMKVQEQVDAGALSAGHARALAALDDGAAQESVAARCVAEGWSVRELERRLQPKGRGRPRQRGADAETTAAAERLARVLGAPVDISRRRRGGEIRIRFSDEDELIRLFRWLVREKS